MKLLQAVPLLGVMLPLALTFAACTGAPQGDALCEGPCCDEACGLERSPLGWEGPVLLWTGPFEATPPACPEQAPVLRYEGFDTLSVTQSCPSCGCSPSGCAPPSRVIGSNVASCHTEEPTGNLMYLDAPVDWDGRCIGREPPIPVTNTLSVWEYGPRITPCEPQAGPEPLVAETSWGLRARACRLAEDRGRLEAPPPDFMRCVVRGGDDAACPDAYPERRVFYEGVDADLGCAPCACGEPQEALCIAFLLFYTDPACATSGFMGGLIDDSVFCGATEGQSGFPQIGGIDYYWRDFVPGHCEPQGGEPIGQASPSGPTTFCCVGAW